MWVDLVGCSEPAPLTRFPYEASPAGPTALIFWVRQGTRWVNSAQSHPEYTCIVFGVIVVQILKKLKYNRIKNCGTEGIYNTSVPKKASVN
jgi:hypothetical protein